MLKIKFLPLFILLATLANAQRNETKATDSNTPLHLLNVKFIH